MTWMSDRCDGHRCASNDAFHEWIRSLPWVVERPQLPGTRGVRAFAVDCEPLGIRQLWLVTGTLGSSRVAVVVPDPIGEGFEHAGLGRAVASLSAEHKLFAVNDDASEVEVERVVLVAYGLALSP